MDRARYPPKSVRGNVPDQGFRGTGTRQAIRWQATVAGGIAGAGPANRTFAPFPVPARDGGDQLAVDFDPARA